MNPSPKKVSNNEGGLQGEQTPLYSGSWTLEEEEYVQSLVKEYRAGNILNLEQGASMRNYIAKMLHCRPKRVTKKYENTGYNGKMTYRSNVVAMTPAEAADRRSMLADQRKMFLASRERRLSRKPYVRTSRSKATQAVRYASRNKGTPESHTVTDASSAQRSDTRCNVPIYSSTASTAIGQVPFAFRADPTRSMLGVAALLDSNSAREALVLSRSPLIRGTSLTTSKAFREGFDLRSPLLNTILVPEQTSGMLNMNMWRLRATNSTLMAELQRESDLWHERRLLLAAELTSFTQGRVSARSLPTSGPRAPVIHGGSGPAEHEASKNCLEERARGV